MDTIKVMQVGMGPIGQKVVRFATKRSGIEFVAAVDPADDKLDRDIGQLCELDGELGIRVAPDIASALAGVSSTEKDVKPDVAILTTVSGFEECARQAAEIAGHGIHIVSTCEEMSFPWDTHPELAKQLDETAKANNVAILGTGVNPGFLMDLLPTVLTGVCQEVESIKVSRVQDATYRRVPFQQKIGAALTLEEFDAKKQTGTLRHVGLTESLQMIAASLGWRLDKTEDVLTPIIAEAEITTGYRKITAGMASGVQQIGTGYVDGRKRIELVFRASVGEKDPADTIEIKGTPNVTSIIPGGVNGDIATCAITVNATRAIMRAAPGLRTMIDMPTVSFFENVT